MTMKRIILTLVAISYAIVSFGFVIISFFVSRVDKQSENTTKCYVATVSEVQIKDNGKGRSVKIVTNEYRNDLIIVYSSVCTDNVVDDINSLQHGQKIYFRIENYYDELMNHGEIMPIVSLETETHSIFSLDEYNELIKETVYPTKVTAVIVTLVFLSVSVLCFFLAFKK